MLIDESDDEPVLPGDVLASEEEIAEAAAHARSDIGGNRRLLRAAEIIWARSQQMKRACQPEDILQEALEAVLDGRRKWKKNRVDFNGLLIGVMRSTVSSRGKTIKKKTSFLTMEHELHQLCEDQESRSLEEIVADPETTESKILRKEKEEMEESRMAILRAKYGATDIHGLILDKVREGYSSQAEIREALGIADSVYWNAWKALMRAAGKLNSNTKE